MSESFPTDERSQRLEQIVAYLDGELSPQESAQVERRLAADEEFRQDLQSIERAWSALDELPQTTVDDNFARTTMEMVANAAGKDVQQMTQALPVQQRKRKLTKALLAVGVALMGVLVGKLLWVDPNQVLIDDLPAIQYVDIYSQIPSADFLRQLDGVITEDALQVTADQREQRLSQFQLVSSTRERETWLDTLESEQRLTLRAKFNRFQAMSEQQQEKIRSLHAEIVAADDSAKLQRVLLLYQQWLQGLSSSEQYKHREKEPDVRVRHIKETIDAEMRDRLLELNEEELERLYEGVKDARQAIIDHLIKDMNDAEKQEFAKKPHFWRLVHAFGAAPRELTDDFASAVFESLPEEKREVYRQLSRPWQMRHFIRWMMQAEPDRKWQGRRNRRKKPSDQELEEFFVENVDPLVYERLMAMPRDRMKREMEKMYRGEFSSNDWSVLREMGQRETPMGGPGRFEGPHGDGPPGPRERLRTRREGEGPGPGGPRFRRDDEGPGARDEGPPRGERRFPDERRPRRRDPIEGE